MVICNLVDSYPRSLSFPSACAPPFGNAYEQVPANKSPKRCLSQMFLLVPSQATRKDWLGFKKVRIAVLFDNGVFSVKTRSSRVGNDILSCIVDLYGMSLSGAPTHLVDKLFRTVEANEKTITSPRITITRYTPGKAIGKPSARYPD